jgi:hypothetical protein
MAKLKQAKADWENMGTKPAQVPPKIEIPDGPCLECDGSGWLDDDCTDMCCECDGTGVAGD